jgi:hypothetical protein
MGLEQAKLQASFELKQMSMGGALFINNKKRIIRENGEKE